jgi:hypothetical protein
MADYVEIYSNAETNDSAITSGSSAVFGQTQSDREAKSRYSSFNVITITSSSSQEIAIKFDGIKQQAILLGAGAFSIQADEGIYFDYAEIINNGTSDVNANEINVRYGVALRRNDPLIQAKTLSQ